jgi:hypothetical protein
MSKDFKEFAWNYIDGQTYGTFTASSYKYINLISKLAEKFPDKIQILYTNSDGSIEGHADKSCFKFVAPKTKRVLTEEQKQAFRERITKK